MIRRFIIVFISLIYLQLISSTTVHCDVIIAGGSTSALAAALSSAREGASTCLLEPTDWPGGQLTSSAVSAIDFGWHTVTTNGTKFSVAGPSHDPKNWPIDFKQMLQNLTTLHTKGKCWVSSKCFPPKNLLETSIWRMISSSPNLRVFYQTVVKRVQSSNSKIRSIVGIQRTVKDGISCNGYDEFLSMDIKEWYNTKASKRFTKKVLIFTPTTGKEAIFVEGTEWGELLALSGAPYLQGVAERYDGDVSGIGNDTCGQSITYDFVQKLHADPQQEPPNPLKVDHPDWYSAKPDGLSRIWSYRRIESGGSWDPQTGDRTLQNWGKGNDYPYGYLFLNKEKTQESLKDWEGGVDISVLGAAERIAYGYHYWFRDQADWTKRVTLDKTALGTCNGLAKMPYIRDTRRSIGMNQFVIKISDLVGTAQGKVANYFPDTLAIGIYDADFHRVKGCQFSSYLNNQYAVVPYYIPYRAMTNQKFTNLVVVGKTMAQSFLSNAAIRLHPEEWSSGTAGGVVAAYLSSKQIGTREGYSQVHLASIQKAARKYTPSQWTIGGKLYPPQ